jgi:hypothetical protein
MQNFRSELMHHLMPIIRGDTIADSSKSGHVSRLFVMSPYHVFPDHFALHLAFRVAMSSAVSSSLSD